MRIRSIIAYSAYTGTNFTVDAKKEEEERRRRQSEATPSNALFVTNFDPFR
jgi:hypothetical protein